MNILITIGVDRILTSGLQAKATHGKEMIKYLQEAYGNSIEILAGSGINALNAKKLMDYTGISQVHSSCKDWLLDSTTSSCLLYTSYTISDHGMFIMEAKFENVEDIQELDNSLKKITGIVDTSLFVGKVNFVLSIDDDGYIRKF